MSTNACRNILMKGLPDMLAMLRIIVKVRSCESVLRKDQRVELMNIFAEYLQICLVISLCRKRFERNQSKFDQ